jgi:SAM-dependent methyltransferase
MSQHAECFLARADAADKVREFYDRYPYPPPVENLDKYRKHWDNPARRQADFRLYWPDCAYRDQRSILVAGCGTSQAAKHALRWPKAQIIGIDCSGTSVHCTEQLKQKYNLRNLVVRQLSIEQASKLGMSFDQVVCTGVLHHLADPEAGLRALRSVLKPDGAVQLMVYGPYGRAGIYMLQEFCRLLGIRASHGEICALSNALGQLPPGHPLQTLLREAPDFRTDAALADALLHPQDRAYSVPQLFDFIEKAGLKFGRWLRQAPYSIHCGVIARLPQSSRIADLPSREQYAAIELFRGTMVRHSIIAYRNDSTLSKRQIHFTDDAWLTYIPIRMPETICIQDRLPPGAAGVLVNQGHTYPDLFLPIGSAEKRWFDGIDGVHRAGEIVERTPAPAHEHGKTKLDAARTFFERLWWHDQVVFDSSREPATAQT